MRRCVQGVGAMLVLAALAACGPGRRELAEVGAVLDRCEEPAACGAAWARLAAMSPEIRDGDAGVAVRIKALRAGIEALAEFPEPPPAFLASAQVDLAGLVKALDAEVKALADNPAAREAGAVLKFQLEPLCANAALMAPVESGSGPFAATARLVRMSALAQLVSAVEPERAETFAEGARLLVGCDLSDRTRPEAMLVEARNRFYDLVAACPEQAAAGALARSCEVARGVVRDRTLPLPLPDVSSGDFAGAVLPQGHGIGLRLTPSWVLVLTAGRLSLLEQKILAPGVRAAGEAPVTELIDLRRPHVLDDIRYVVAATLKTHPPMAWRDGIEILAVAVDQSAVFSDVAEVLEAIVAETDAHPVVAMLPPGYRTPLWLPVNFRMSFRPLMDPLGQIRKFALEGAPLDLALTPFSITVRGKAERIAEIPRGADPDGVRKADLRDAYGLVAERIGSAANPSAHLAVAAAVPAGLLFPLLDALSVRFPPEAMATLASFAAARTPLGKQGRPEMLLPTVVIRSEGTPAE